MNDKSDNIDILDISNIQRGGKNPEKNNNIFIYDHDPIKRSNTQSNNNTQVFDSFYQDRNKFDENLGSNYQKIESVYINKIPSRSELDITQQTSVMKNNIFNHENNNCNEINSYQQSDNSNETSILEEKKNYEENKIENFDFENSYFIIKVKEEKKELLSSYKVYEIFFYEFKNETSLKCYRRYDNFYKLYQKIKDEFPLVLLPRIPPKNPYMKFMKVDEEFYETRRIQLEFFLNYINKNEYICKCEEFKKFLSDAEFDENYYISFNNKLRNFPNSLKISENFKNKFLGFFSNIWSGKISKRILTENERLIKKLEIHYKTVLEKYEEIKDKIFSYLKTLINSALGYKNISSSLLFVKDTIGERFNTGDFFDEHSVITKKLCEINQNNFENLGRKILIKFDNFLNVFHGLCDLLDRYNTFLGTYESVRGAHEYSDHHKLEERDEIVQEFNNIEELKEIFEKKIIEEKNLFDKNYSDQYNDIIEEFVELLKNINKEVFFLLKNFRN